MKKILRKQVLEQLRAFPPDLKRAADQRLLETLLGHKSYREANVFATYLSLEHEVATASLLEHALAAGKRVLVPKTYPHGQMVFVDYDPKCLKMSQFGILEPTVGEVVDKSELDLIHVPGLVWNGAGYRIGYGGGFYDRYLADFRGKSLSTAYAFQIRDFEPTTYDISVQEVLVDETCG